VARGEAGCAHEVVTVVAGRGYTSPVMGLQSHTGTATRGF